MEFGAFVNFLGKQDGLVHISELAAKRTEKVSDVVKEGGKFHFQANPTGVKYSTKTSSEEGKKVATAKFGVAVHTMYHGKTMEDMKAEYAPDLSGLNITQMCITLIPRTMYNMQK